MDTVPEPRSRELPDAKAVKAVNAWWSTLAGFCASLVGIGLARFAYTPLLPAIVGAHWFDASMAAYLSAANLAGYLAGALLGRPIAARTTVVFTLRAMMVLATIAFIACSYPVAFSWFFVWRFFSGLARKILVGQLSATIASIPDSSSSLMDCVARIMAALCLRQVF